jgi:RNA polymerase sigma-70 factor (ECF subfamily)
VSSLNDEQVMEKIQDGKVEMLAILFERHHIKLYNFFLRLTANKNVSEDLVQEVFLRILKYGSSYKTSSTFLCWMFQIARNIHCDYLKIPKTERSIEEKEYEIPAEAINPIERIDLEQNIELLNAALQQLPEHKRQILMLSCFHHLKYKEIADIMECTLGQVKILLHRSLKELQKNFCVLKGGPLS